MKKILQTIAGFSAHCGGTSTCTYDLLSAMHNIGCRVDLMSVQSDDLMGHGEKWIKALPDDAITSYGYSSNMNEFLAQSDYDLYHTNGLWMHCNHETCVAARRKGKPYIITPHGMLYPQAMARSTWKKRLLMMAGGVDRDLRLADCIHCTCTEEMVHFRNLGYRNPVAVIPNPVPIPPYVDELKHERSIKRIGFLGRLHPRKNVKTLIEAWRMLGSEVANAELVIMGKGDDEYETMLKNYAVQYGLHNVEFLGFVSGHEKFERLAGLTALCVPSDFENFGMIVTESLSVGTPVIASKGTPWEELNSCHCGWWVNNDIQTLAQTIEKALSLSEEEKDAMGERGKKLIVEKYSDIQVAIQMKQLYEWILNGGEKLEFVFE